MIPKTPNMAGSKLGFSSHNFVLIYSLYGMGAEEVSKRPAEAFAVPTCREFIAMKGIRADAAGASSRQIWEVLGDQILSGL
jgi:hypothetical protein